MAIQTKAKPGYDVSMSEPNRVVIDRVDWKSILPVLRLASAFKHALQPGKLAVALLAVLTIHLSGTVLDFIWGDAAQTMFGTGSSGIYESLARDQGYALDDLFQHAMALELGTSQSLSGVISALREVFIGIPTHVIKHHPWFMLLFGADVLFILMLTMGVLTRMSATQVCVNRLTTLGDAAGAIRRRWAWYVLTPLMPTALLVVLGALLALAGLVLFNLPGMDIAGALIYGVLLLLGVVIAVVAVLLLLALFLMPPALSVEGSDGFDAIARSFNYILFRPWQFAGYLLASLVYLAVVYLLVGTVALLAIDVTTYGVAQGVVVDREPTDVSVWIMARWGELVGAIVAAILLSTFCCLQTQVYVLMRRSADGTPMDQCECEGDDAGDLWAQKSAEEKPVDAAESED